MANPNVLFKRGLQNSLPSGSTIIDGAFYLTTDTHRLYVGQQVGQDLKTVLLNQTVQFVSSINELTTISSAWTTAAEKEAHLQDLYYVLPGGGGQNTHGGNILAVWCKDTSNNSYSWVQINPDHNTFVTDFMQSILASGNDGVQVRSSLRQNDGNDDKVVSFTIKGQNVNVQTDGSSGIKIIGDTYTLSRPAVGEIRLNSALEQEASSVKIIAGDNVTIGNGTNNNEIKVTAKDTTNASAGLVLDANGKLTMKVTDSDGNEVTASTSNIAMTYGSAGQFSAPIGTKMDVYAKDEIDAKFKNLNGLTYIGTIGNSNSGASFSIGADYAVYNGATKIAVHNGDMFLVTDSIKYSADGAAVNGDLLIATGTEDGNGNLTSITWTYVPAGDDATLDTTYKFLANAASNSMTITANNNLDGENTAAGKITVKAGTATTVTSTASGANNSELTVTVGHANVTNSAKSGTAIDLNTVEDVNVITGVTVNAQGHVTEVVTSKVSAPRYKLSAAPNLTAAVNGISTSVSIKQGLILGSEDAVYQTTGYKLMSDSLTISKVGNDVQIDCVWGSF